MLPRLHLVGPSWEAEQTRVLVSWSFKGSVCLEKQRRLECIFLKCLHCLESSAPHVQPRCVSTDQGEPAALPTFGHGRAFLSWVFTTSEPPCRLMGYGISPGRHSWHSGVWRNKLPSCCVLAFGYEIANYFSPFQWQ